MPLYVMDVLRIDGDFIRGWKRRSGDREVVLVKDRRFIGSNVELCLSGRIKLVLELGVLILARGLV